MRLSKEEKKKIENEIRIILPEYIKKFPEAWNRKVEIFNENKKAAREMPDICSFSFKDPVEYFVWDTTNHMVQNIKNGMYHHDTRYTIYGKEYSLFEIEMMLKFHDEHDPGDDDCKKDYQCLSCGIPICFDCCHWSPLLYKYPNKVYCPRCCPSCHFTEKIKEFKKSKNKRIIKKKKSKIEVITVK